MLSMCLVIPLSLFVQQTQEVSVLDCFLLFSSGVCGGE